MITDYHHLTEASYKSTEKAKRIAFTMEAYVALRPKCGGCWPELEIEINRCAIALAKEIRAN